jgi:hypothetical protein
MKNKKPKRRSIKHRFGNWIGSFLVIGDGIVLLLTLGNYSPSLNLWFLIYRKSNKFLFDE